MYNPQLVRPEETNVILPLNAEARSDIVKYLHDFEGIEPQLLLFLRKLRKLSVSLCSDEEKKVLLFERHDLPNNIITLSRNGIKDQEWFVFHREFVVGSVTRGKAKTTTISLAFPLHIPSHVPREELQCHVYSFLPVQPYGFKFIIQGDFVLPSSREKVMLNNKWNEWLCLLIPSCFLDVVHFVRTCDGERYSGLHLSALDLLRRVPLPLEILDLFKPVAHKILDLLRGNACVPTSIGVWHMPHMVLRANRFFREMFSNETVHQYTKKYFIRDDLLSLPEQISIALG